MSIYLVVYDKITIGLFSVITSYYASVTMQYGTLSSFSNTFSMVKANVIRITEMFSKIKSRKSMTIKENSPVSLEISDCRLEYSSKVIENLKLTDGKVIKYTKENISESAVAEKLLEISNEE